VRTHRGGLDILEARALTVSHYLVALFSQICLYITVTGAGQSTGSAEACGGKREAHRIGGRAWREMQNYTCITILLLHAEAMGGAS
jgi:hypothetical protein